MAEATAGAEGTGARAAGQGEGQGADHSQDPGPVLRAEVERLRVRVAEAERDAALRTALGAVDWFDAEDAYRALAPRVVRGEDGTWRANAGSGADGQTGATLAETVRELARGTPHWVRARVSGGTGATGAGGGAGPAGIAGAGSSNGGASAPLSYADLLRPENSALLQDFIHNRREELERLRAGWRS